jgi:hypothetical protein
VVLPQYINNYHIPIMKQGASSSQHTFSLPTFKQPTNFYSAPESQIRPQKHATPFTSNLNQQSCQSMESYLPPSKRYKNDSYSFDSQETTETTRDIHWVVLECNENLGVPEVDEELLEKEEHAHEELAIDTFDSDTYSNLISREQYYAADSYYLEKCQPELTWTMRLILVDWMMDVCTEFQLKRETFHYAVSYLDRFLSKVPKLSKSSLQLLGTSSLHLASKVEEISVPRIQDFARATDNGYTIIEIRDMENYICKTLQWELSPPTLNMWANWYMRQWDFYIQYSEYAMNHILVKSLNDPIVVFKVPNEKSYARFRELTQLIDLIVLDVVFLRYQPRALATSALYVLLAFHFGQASLEEIATQFPTTSSFLDPRFPFNDLFGNFLGKHCRFELSELLPSIQYMAGFLALHFDYSIHINHNPEIDVIFY